MAQSADRIVNSLRNKYVEVDVLHFSSKRQYPDRLEKNGWYKCRLIGLDAAHSLNLIWNEIESLDESWTHVAAFGGLFPLLAGPVFSSWLNAKLLVHLRGNDFDTGVFTPRKSEILRSALAEADAVCCVSTDKVERVKQMFPGINAQWTPNGIDLTLWQPLKSDFGKRDSLKQSAKGKKIIGFFGHLKEKKGLSFFLDSLKKSGALSEVHLLLVGELEPQSFEKIENMEELSYSHIPFVDRYDLIPYYLACDFIALPSFYDGMPNVILESGTLGGVFISSDAGGMRDVFKDEENGFVFQKGNAAHCRDAIRRAIKCDRKVLDEMSERNKEYFSKEFTADKEVGKHLQVLVNQLEEEHV
ncbi:MAG: glycosyltransferase family 4 protein [Lentisphaeraceae bacterium]|nr:glycosyltransferase family 4 protein [Lentisphaeraceae bacterium]